MNFWWLLPGFRFWVTYYIREGGSERDTERPTDRQTDREKRDRDRDRRKREERERETDLLPGGVQVLRHLLPQRGRGGEGVGSTLCDKYRRRERRERDSERLFRPLA